MGQKNNTRFFRTFKKKNHNRQLSMLTCYDYQSAQMLGETDVDFLLVGDSVGNVILGLETTVGVTLEHMKVFGRAVTRGAPNKFVIIDLPFGTYAQVDTGLKNAIDLFQTALPQAVKIEGASEVSLELIQHLTKNGIPVVGHIGLTPQSVHQLGGFYTHGKDGADKERLIKEAQALTDAGVFALVLECVTPALSREITERITIPTIGIGSGTDTDGQVLVINDLLKMGKENPPKFCEPVANLYSYKMKLINQYLEKVHQGRPINRNEISH